MLQKGRIDQRGASGRGLTLNWRNEGLKLRRVQVCGRKAGAGWQGGRGQ